MVEDELHVGREVDQRVDRTQVEQAAALEPNNPEGYHRVAVFYWDKSRGDFRLSDAQKRAYRLADNKLAEQAGWDMYYVVSVLLAVPGLLLVWFMRDKIKQLDQPHA